MINKYFQVVFILTTLLFYYSYFCVMHTLLNCKIMNIYYWYYLSYISYFQYLSTCNIKKRAIRVRTLFKFLMVIDFCQETKVANSKNIQTLSVQSTSSVKTTPPPHIHAQHHQCHQYHCLHFYVHIMVLDSHVHIKKSLPNPNPLLLVYIFFERKK